MYQVDIIENVKMPRRQKSGTIFGQVLLHF